MSHVQTKGVNRDSLPKRRGILCFPLSETSLRLLLVLRPLQWTSTFVQQINHLLAFGVEKLGRLFDLIASVGTNLDQKTVSQFPTPKKMDKIVGTAFIPQIFLQTCRLPPALTRKLRSDLPSASKSPCCPICHRRLVKKYWS